MKKLLVLLLISALAIFVFTGCETVVPPTNGDDDDDNGGVVEEVTVDIESMVDVGGWAYVKGGNNDITVTFAEPVEGFVTVDVTDCSGDYSKAQEVGLFPNEDKTVWTGSVSFDCAVTTADPCEEDTCVIGDCCSSTVTVDYGEEAKYQFPVIVDCEDPYLGLEIAVDECYCGGCEVSFESQSETDICEGTDECCGDDCSGIAGWAISIYDYADNPFDVCCDLTCAEPVWSDSGVGCPVDTTTTCLESMDYIPMNGRQPSEIPDSGVYILLVEVEDNVGNVSKGLFAFGVAEDDSGDGVECFILFGDIRYLEDCVDPEDKNNPWYKTTTEKYCQIDGVDFKEWLIEVGDECDLKYLCEYPE